MLRLAFDFIIAWRETRTRPNAYSETIYLKGRYNDFDRMIHLIRPVVVI